MAAQMQAIQGQRQSIAALKVPFLAFVILAVAIVVALVFAARIPALGSGSLSDRAIGVPTGGLAGPSQLQRITSLGVPFAGGLAGPSQLYVPHTSYPQTTRTPLKITGPLHPPRNPRRVVVPKDHSVTQGVDPVVTGHSRAV